MEAAFDEEHRRVRRDHGPEQFAILRRLALTLRKPEKSEKLGARATRLKAGWDDEYLSKVLGA